ncbi:murein hydrolase activator EnvC [Homoserinibacter sp. GY 40078]|uniref:murein hydrolase activator EnvC family protein n=1 Tax=Homoserinibacter sp. GY 40078 TaxID=2603275 RepID=UPI0021061DA0|nr:M23 family metallopeptidase [Homoserinibacter sp. GY 40078]
MLTATLWGWPVAGSPHAVVRPFVAPADAYAAGHRGVDLFAAADAEVRAPADGVVRFSGWVVDRPVLTIDHGDGVVSSVEPVESDLAAGDVVSRGQTVGRVTSDASHCVETCLHLGVRVDGAYVSPLLFLGGQPRAVLLPP